MKENYQIKMEKIIEQLPRNSKKKLLLHVCCAPCSTYVLELLQSKFDITLFYYNPNIFPVEEWERRGVEVEKLVKQIKLPISVVTEEYENNLFEEKVAFYQNEKEGGKRCFICYQIRLEKAAKYAKDNDFDYFTTTLSISPYKNATILNKIGCELENKYQVSYLYADFKKKNGYKRSIELSSIYHLYRQEYCGCIYSKKEKEGKI